jgi:hypothetical protein
MSTKGSGISKLSERGRAAPHTSRGVKERESNNRDLLHIIRRDTPIKAMIYKKQNDTNKLFIRGAAGLRRAGSSSVSIPCDTE